MQLVDAGGYLTGKFARLPGDDRVRLLMIADPGIIEGAVRLLRLWAIAAAFGLRALPRLFAHSRGGCNYKGMRGDVCATQTRGCGFGSTAGWRRSLLFLKPETMSS